MKKKSAFAIAALCMLLVLTSAFMPTTAANYKDIGVSTGIIATYQYNTTALASLARLSVYYQSVVGTNATIIITTYFGNGTVYNNFTKIGNISQYTFVFSQNLRPYVVAANLNVGDNVTCGAPVAYKLNSSSTMSFAGAERTVLNLNYAQLGKRTDFYYDKTTGVTVKANIYEGGTTWENITLVSTNAWSAAPTGGFDTLLMAGIGIGGLVVGLAVGLVIGRRKKR